LGLGASHPGFVEGLHNVDYQRPVRRSHETIELIRALSQRMNPVEYEGQLFEVEGFAPLDEPFPIYNAALGPANRRATGRLADGWIPYLLPKSQLDAAFDDVATAAREAGRDPADITVTPQILAAVDDDPAVAREPIRDYVATYIGNYGAYRRIIAEDFPDATEAVAEAHEAGDEAAARASVTDEMLAEFGVAGTPESARSQLRDVLAIDAVDRVIVYPPAGISADMLDRTVDKLSLQSL
jgi:alkanesulfonate monooxygenase SsuD/methylene tetrahydromethanopterin reductase-like flavin-dependent oxidoreductase (luciferase family)